MTSGSGLIWLVDATTYRRPLDAEVHRHKDRYFRLEGLARHSRIGATAPRGTRTYSAGLLRLGSILRASGFAVRYLRIEDAEGELDSGAFAVEPPAVIGFGAVCPTVPRCARLAERARARLPKLCTVLGGPQAVVSPRLVAERFGAAFGVVSPAFDADAAAVLAGVSRFALTLPAELDYRLLPHPLADYGINLMTASGCPFTCTYCQDRLVPRARGDLDGGLGGILDRLPARTPVHICDSVLGGSVPRAHQVAGALAELDHGMVISCDLRPEFVSPALLQDLERAGFADIRLGLDSADEEVLATARRRPGPSQLPTVLRTIREVSELYVSIYMVTGLPGSTPATLGRNLDVVAQLLEGGLADQVRHHLYVPYPTDDCPSGSPGVRILDHDWSGYDRNSRPVYDLDGLTQEQIWDAFIATEETIGVSWTKALGVDEATIDEQPRDHDYNVAMYLEDEPDTDEAGTAGTAGTAVGAGVVEAAAARAVGPAVP